MWEKDEQVRENEAVSPENPRNSPLSDAGQIIAARDAAQMALRETAAAEGVTLSEEDLDVAAPGPTADPAPRGIPHHYARLQHDMLRLQVGPIPFPGSPLTDQITLQAMRGVPHPGAYQISP